MCETLGATHACPFAPVTFGHCKYQYSIPAAQLFKAHVFIYLSVFMTYDPMRKTLFNSCVNSYGETLSNGDGNGNKFQVTKEKLKILGGLLSSKCPEVRPT